jgi:hypothetical protein
MMKGDENCSAASAALVRKIVRRSTGQDRCEVPILFSHTRFVSLAPTFFDAVEGGERNPSGSSLPMTIPGQNLQPSA